MEFSPQQDQAIKAVRKWLKSSSGPQIFRLFGFAGTGKTTLAKHLAEDSPGAIFCCFTGKAALVLRKKGCEGASTIHSAIYKANECQITGRVTFDLNPESPVATSSLVIVDEVSMVGEELGRDLLSFGTKILVLGDPFQLPPIKGEGFFTAQTPDILLTEIHRQAADNPIIRMSMDVREGRPLKVGKYGDSMVVRREDIEADEMREWVMKSDQLLCGKNLTRTAFNRRYRKITGMDIGDNPSVPIVGDKLVCLKNNRTKGFLNGGLWEVKDAQFKPRIGMVELDLFSLDDDSGYKDAEVPIEFFTGNESELDWRDLKRVDQFTFGYCLTVHKSQGSQWDDVLLFDESSIFRDTRLNHLYTGITRAADRIRVVKYD